MKKKFLMLIIVAVIGAIVLVGCDNKGEALQENNQIEESIENKEKDEEVEEDEVDIEENIEDIEKTMENTDDIESDTEENLSDGKTEENIIDETVELEIEEKIDDKSETNTLNETNSAFYEWIHKDTEAEGVAYYTEIFGVSEAELRTWNRDQWLKAEEKYWASMSDSNSDDVCYSIMAPDWCTGYISCSYGTTVYDVLLEEGCLNYKTIMLNGVVVTDLQNTVLPKGIENDIDVR